MKLCGLFGVMFVAVAAGPTLAERSSPSAWDGALWSVQAVVPAAGAERVLQLSATMQIAGLLTVMRAEGADYGKTLQEEMFPGKGGSSWDAAVSGIYDEAAMKLLFEKALIAELGAVDPKTLEVIEAFFGSDRGQRILTLEVEARRALLDQETEDAAKVHVEDLAAKDDPRLSLIREFAKTNDLVEMNVVGALNANLAFFEGMASAGGVKDDMTQEQMLQNVWSQEQAIREETETWLFPYLAMAYQPLSDDDLKAYLAFSELDEGKVLNDAVFAAFNTLFTDISRKLGRAAAKQINGEDI